MSTGKVDLMIWIAWFSFTMGSAIEHIGRVRECKPFGWEGPLILAVLFIFNFLLGFSTGKNWK